MTATIISNTPPFGALTNEAVARLYEANDLVTRLTTAVATAASGYSGVAGTEYEGNSTNFGVVASGTPGENGAAYAYAVNVLGGAWTTFWASAKASIEQLDNGVTLP